MLGVFGGTFDPVHYGHLKPAQAVMQALKLSQLRFIPNRVPPHRAPPWLPVEQRQALLELALQDYPAFILDTRELQRGGPSYMVDTLESLQEDFTGETLCLILGLDAFAGFTQWHQWARILTLSHLVVTQRPGFDWSATLKTLDSALARKITSQPDDLHIQAAGRILLQSAPQLPISSTLIRQRVQRGESVADLMPEKAVQQLMRFLQHD
ncbi:MAG TPA: nicotinate-nucleotide adenylyltransferase [Thiotrichales bacterium]|nr:nicotinate-nucleotide adenylyltransferase [Thiotrichales bacterium]